MRIFLLALFVSLVSAQDAMTGNSFPALEVFPADDSLIVLESSVESAEWKLLCSEAEYQKVLDTQPRTAAERAQHLQNVKEARYTMYMAKAEHHKAQGLWCAYYASIATEDAVIVNARLSAHKHRYLAGNWETRAIQLSGVTAPKIEHMGKLKLDING